jgi:hypothetical protein
VWIGVLVSWATGIAAADAQQTAQTNDVFQNPESLVRGLYAAVTFDAGSTPDWDFVREFFAPEAVIVARNTPTTMELMNVDAFVAWFVGDVEKFRMKERGFEETVKKFQLTVYGDIAHAFVVYHARLKTPVDSPGNLGLDSFALMKKDGRWWIVSITNDVVTAQRPLPEELR